jgi:hypothetical protein
VTDEHIHLPEFAFVGASFFCTSLRLAAAFRDVDNERVGEWMLQVATFDLFCVLSCRFIALVPASKLRTLKKQLAKVNCSV